MIIECLRNHYFFRLLKHSSFNSPGIRQHLCDLRTPFHVIGHPISCIRTCLTYGTAYCVIDHQILPTQPRPREPVEFSRGGKYFKHVLLPTYVAYLQPKGISDRFYLCARFCYKTCQPLTKFESNL